MNVSELFSRVEQTGTRRQDAFAGANSHTGCCTLTVASSSVADSQVCQVVQEMLEIGGREGRLEPLLLLVQPGKTGSWRAGEAFTQTHKKTLNNQTVNFLWTQNDTSEAILRLWLIYQHPFYCCLITFRGEGRKSITARLFNGGLLHHCQRTWRRGKMQIFLTLTLFQGRDLRALPSAG